MKIALVQFETDISLDPDSRLSNLINLLPPAGSCDLVILPELWLQGAFEFSFFSEEVLSQIESKFEILGGVAKKNNYWLHAGSFLVREGTNIFNKAFLFDSKGEIRANYRKNYVFGFDDGEAKFVSPSSECEIVETPWGRIGFAICYDLRFPEHFRRVTLAGAEIILICAAWPETRIGHWKNLICSRAIENQLFVIGCNGVGEQTGATLGGNSIIVAPDGETLLELGNQQSVTYLEIDTKLIQEQRVSFPVLKDIK